MTKFVKKVKKKSIGSREIALFAIFAIAITLLLNTKSTPLVQNSTHGISQVTTSTIPNKLEMVKYTLEQTGNGKVLRSSNYHFEIVFPNYYDDFNIGGGFDKYFPDNQTTSVGGKYRSDPSDKDDFMSYDINIGSLNDQSIQDIVDKEVEGIKRSLTQAGKTEKDAQIQTRTLITQTGEFIRLRHIDAFNFESVAYYIPYNNKYYRISTGQSRSTRFSQTQLNEIDQLIKSFKFTK